MADFDEELKRQAAIASLLAQQPDTPDPSDSDQGYAESMAPVIKPDTQEEYHKLINQAFDTKTDEQVTAQPAPELPYEVPRAKTQEEYDQHMQEWAQEMPNVTFPRVSEPPPANLPGIVTPLLPKINFQLNPGIAQDRGELWSPLDTKVDEQVVDTPVDSKGIPLDEKPTPQLLDKGEALAQLTRVERGRELTEPWQPRRLSPTFLGFVEGSQNAIVNPAAGVTPPAPKPAYPEEIVTPDEASGAKSIVNAPAAAAAVAPAPDQTQVIQPASNDDYNKLMDSFFPSAQTKAEVGTGDMPPMLNAPNGQAPAALIIHHTGGNNSAQSVVDDWRTNRPGVGAQMIMDRTARSITPRKNSDTTEPATFSIRLSRASLTRPRLVSR